MADSADPAMFTDPPNAEEIVGELMYAVGPVDFVEDVARIGLDLYGDVPITWRTFRKAVARAALEAEESAND